MCPMGRAVGKVELLLRKSLTFTTQLLAENIKCFMVMALAQTLFKLLKAHLLKLFTFGSHKAGKLLLIAM